MFLLFFSFFTDNSNKSLEEKKQDILAKMPLPLNPVALDAKTDDIAKDNESEKETVKNDETESEKLKESPTRQSPKKKKRKSLSPKKPKRKQVEKVYDGKFFSLYFISFGCLY